MENQKRVSRYDSISPGQWMTKPFVRTPEGFLSGRAIVTSVGVFTYRNKDGSTSRELRLPEEVFSRDSLDTMKLKPVVNDHPKEKVTQDNVQKYQVGSLGSNPSSETQWAGLPIPDEKVTDGFHVAIDMTINRADAIEDILNGKRALSMGYECDTEMAEPGSVWCGVEYDCIQRNIRYNHVAIVDAARAGDAARIRMDSGDAVLINHTDADNPRPESNQEDKTMKKVRLDNGVECEGDNDLVNAYVTAKEKADSAEKTLTQAKADHAKAVSTLEAERDAQKDRADKAEKALKEAQDAASDTKRIDEAVNAKLMLIDAAAMAKVEITKDMSDLDVKKAVITAVSPNTKLDGKDENYVSVRFDIAVEELAAHKDSESRAVIGGNKPHADSEDREDSATAHQRMIDRMVARSRGDEVKE